MLSAILLIKKLLLNKIVTTRQVHDYKMGLPSIASSISTLITAALLVCGEGADFVRATPATGGRCAGFSCLRAIAGRTFGKKMEFQINNLWNGDPDPNNQSVKLTLKEEKDGMVIEVEAPYYDDPKPPNGKSGEAYYKLWEYEVVEAFFLASSKEEYLELEFGPHGQHLVLLLNGTRQAVKHSLDLEYSAEIDGKVWRGVAVIPKSYFPEGFDKWNAYAIHGTEETERVYKALFPVPGANPDFHRLDDFQEIKGLECLKAVRTDREAEQKKLVWSS